MISRTVRRLLRAICSYNGALALELDRDRPGGRLVDLEEMPRLELAGTRDEVRRERLDPRVQLGALVVVELAGVRDLRLGRRQLLLQRQEVLVGLQLRVVLGDRDEPPESRRDLVLRLRLI